MGCGSGNLICAGNLACKQGNVPHNTLLSPGEQGLKMKLPTPVPSAPLRRSDQISKLRGNAMAQSSAATSLSPIHSLKAAGRTASRGTQSSTQRRANNTKSRPSLANTVRLQNEQKRGYLPQETADLLRVSCRQSWGSKTRYPPLGFPRFLKTLTCLFQPSSPNINLSIIPFPILPCLYISYPTVISLIIKLYILFP